MRYIHGALLVAFAAPTAAAQTVDCDTIGGSARILYGTGGAAQRDLMGQAALVLQSAADPLYVVFQDGEACAGLYALIGLAPPTISGTAFYWDSATGARRTCNLSLTGDAVDFISMINTEDLCGLVTDPSLMEGITRLTTPVSAVSVVVDADSTEQAISAEMFYLIYGFGAAAGITPWTNPDPAYYVSRDENAASKLILALASGLPSEKFIGVDAGSSNGVVVAITSLADPNAGIAFIPTDIADANRATVRTLAWQGLGQNAAYWPDSTATSFDKRNVRFGQYDLWSPGYLFAPEGPTEGSFADPDVQRLVEYVAGRTQPAGATQSAAVTAMKAKNIPPCAMHVARTTDAGPVFAQEPEAACDCLFEFTVTGATACASCDDATPCASGVCRDAFCEAN